jgi:lysophospholipase
VILLPGYAESAEVYFETVRDLLARGCTVWVLEAAGQGGSGRFPGPRDVGRSKGARIDAGALNRLIRTVVRPADGEPVVVAASGTAALAALLASEDGLAVDGLVLWSPDLARRDARRAREMTRWGFGWVRAEGAKPWIRPDRDLSGRATLPLAWQTANPDLRMGGPSWGLLAAEAEGLREATDPQRVRRIRSPVLVIDSTAESAQLCTALPRCSAVPLRAAAPAHLAPDPVRAVWLDRLTDFVDARVGERDHAS